MKHLKKLSKAFLVVSFVVTLFSFLAPTENAEEVIIQVEPGWYWTSNFTLVKHESQLVPALAVFNGQLHMVHKGSGYNLYHSYYDGILWSEAERISNHPSQTGPGLAFYNGLLHMVHLDSKSSSIYHSTFDGISWSSQVKVLACSSSASPAIVAFDNQLHMVYKSDASPDIHHSTYNGSLWTDHGAIPDHGTNAAPVLAVFGNYLHMVYPGRDANDLWHSIYNGSVWSQGVKVLDYTTQFPPSLAECNGELHMVHKGELTNEIYHSSYNGTSWSARGTIPDQTTGTSPVIASFNGPMHIVYGDEGSNDLFESLYMAKVCLIPAYQPDFWNYYMEILRNNNCYNYSNNKRTDTFAQPGRAAGQKYTSLTCPAVEVAAIADGILKLEGDNCLNGENKIALVVAPDFDYHWYRMDSNGYWSHKPGGTSATNLDNSGNIITNPEIADRGNYTDFCGYFCTCSSDIQGIGHEIISLMITAEEAAEEPIRDGLKVTVMIYSGRPNPTYLVPAGEKRKQEMIMGFFAPLETDCNFKKETVIPSILGYKGILVEKTGDCKTFPYDRVYIYKENIETHADKVEGKQFMLDGGLNLEDYFLRLALEEGVISKEMLQKLRR